MLTLSNFRQWSASLEETDSLMPVLFVGHGSPMNAIEDNEYSRVWKDVGAGLPRPKAILCVSAHWETRGTKITAMEKPRMIYDFGGFPRELSQVQYPAPGSEEWAMLTKESLTSIEAELDHQWGFDHGAWSILVHLFPKADVPVLQLSLDYTQPPSYHYELAKQLYSLRKKGVLIIGSGNMVHNLRMVSWQQPGGFDWADSFNEKLKTLIQSGDHKALANYQSLGTEAALSIPSPDHYLPLLYTLALQGKDEPVSFFNDKTLLGSLSMTSVRIGA